MRTMRVPYCWYPTTMHVLCDPLGAEAHSLLSCCLPIVFCCFRRTHISYSHYRCAGVLSAELSVLRWNLAKIFGQLQYQDDELVSLMPGRISAAPAVGP